MKFVVFGAGGFVGNLLTEFLRNSGHSVLPILRKSGIKESLSIDITDKSQFELLANFIPDVVINCASALPGAGSLNDASRLLNFYNTNVVGGANIANWSLANGAGKIINCSTLAVIAKPWPIGLSERANTYPNGVHVAYCTSKLAQELVMSQIAVQDKVPIIHLRLSAIYGPGMKWEGILPKLITDFDNILPVKLKNGNNVFFNFLHVHDLCRLILKASITRNIESGVYNAAANEEISLFNLAALIKGELRSTSILTNEENDDMQSHAQVNNEKLLHAINEQSFNYTSIAQGVAQMIAAYKSNNI
jgi:UDP-glucose 4-epimerase